MVVLPIIGNEHVAKIIILHVDTRLVLAVGKVNELII